MRRRRVQRIMRKTMWNMRVRMMIHMGNRWRMWMRRGRGAMI